MAKSSKRDIRSYVHADKKRVNNPPVGLVTPETDKDTGKKTYQFDPHFDPQLVWSGKAEQTSFRFQPCRCMFTSALTRAPSRTPSASATAAILSFRCSRPQRKILRSAAIQFYKHKHNWTNRLIAGDSLLVMNSLVEKEGLGGKVQMIYVDPPYGIDYASNFQPFATNRTVKDRDADLTQEPEMIRAFRDTWHLGIHSYLTHLHQRLLLAYNLLHVSGSLFVQIGRENVHLIRSILDEVFGRQNFISPNLFPEKDDAAE